MTLEGILPPFIANPIEPARRSPYKSTILELVNQFATSSDRIDLLKGLIDYRRALIAAGITNGFQWIDGSFVEDVEKNIGRSPSDIDVVTFFERPVNLKSTAAWTLALPRFAHLLESRRTKIAFSCDAYGIDLDAPAISIVDLTHYFYGLFAHQRRTLLWKGILEIPLQSNAEDQRALQHLNNLALR